MAVPGSPRLRWVDVAIDAHLSNVSRVARSVATALATALGVATLIVVTSVSRMSDQAIRSAFDRLLPTLVTARPAHIDELPPTAYDDDAFGRLRALPGVRAAGIAVSFAPRPVTARTSAREITAPLVGATPQLLVSTGSTLGGGPVPLIPRSGRVAFVGGVLAKKLAVSDPADAPSIWISGEPFVVLGIITESETSPELLDSVVVPITTVSGTVESVAAPEDAKVSVLVRRGAASSVAVNTAVALAPERPGSFTVDVATRPVDLQTGISAEGRRASIAVGLLALLLGCVSIANVVASAVHERSNEFGLRRAMGARRGDIARLVLIESAELGALGGAMGMAIGIVGALVASRFGAWRPAVAWPSLGIGFGSALGSGVIAGIWPSRRAASVPPNRALRSG